jgi:hypothetical protein
MTHNIIKYLAAIALGAMLLANSALATPTLVIWDDGGASSAVTLADPTGIAMYVNPTFDNAWSVVISTAETKPAFGSATSPVMDIMIQATSLGTSGRNLHFSWSDDAFGPLVNGVVQAQLSGHVVSGTGAGVQYQTFYHAGAGVWNTATAPSWTQLTDSGVLTPPYYMSIQNNTLVQSSFGLDEYLTIAAVPGGSYSLDASLIGNGGEGFHRDVPDSGNTLLLLGLAFVAIATLRPISHKAA